MQTLSFPDATKGRPSFEAFNVLLALTEECSSHGSGVWYVTAYSVAKRAGISRRSAIGYLARLRKLGLVERSEASKFHASSFNRRQHFYRPAWREI